MKKIYIKLIEITLILIVSVAVVVASSYAWMVLSGNPVADGIQVAIGGGSTILVAPDVTQTVDGVVYHYPGYFSDSMNILQQRSYDYLQNIAGLTPVSTADGVNWYLPEYYDISDGEVRSGKVLSGQLKDVSEFTLDSELVHANIPKGNDDLIEKGSYIYLDFWVVSPGADYYLRLSTGEDTGGTFLLDLPQAQQRKDGTGYDLVTPINQGAAAVRIGFLANDVQLTDDTMLHYQKSNYAKDQYTRLRGLYQEPNTGTANLDDNRFTIYEPNGDLHPTGIAEAGSYVFTNPVGLVDGAPAEVLIADRLTVQKSGGWTMAENGTGAAIEQQFQTALIGMQDLAQLEEREITERFLTNYLQWKLDPYYSNGKFIKYTTDLYKYTGKLTAENIASLEQDGATEDVYIIKLERNVPQRIRMFIWLEGQDIDCVNAVNMSRFLVNLELAGGTE